jgi:hypothetical protein
MLMPRSDFDDMDEDFSDSLMKWWRHPTEIAKAAVRRCAKQ